jgi:hypothetical protein
MIYRELNLPTNVAKYCLEQSLVNELAIYLALKAKYCRRVAKSDIDYAYLTEVTGLSEYTAKKCIATLISIHWITEQPFHLYFKSFRLIGIRLGLSRSRIHKVDIQNDLPHLKELLFTLAMIWLIRFRKYARRTRLRCRNAISMTGVLQSYDDTTLSVRLIAELLNLSPSKVHRLKTSAKRLGFLIVEPNFVGVNKKVREWIGYTIPSLNRAMANLRYLRITDDIFPQIDTKMPFLIK